MAALSAYLEAQYAPTAPSTVDGVLPSFYAAAQRAGLSSGISAPWMGKMGVALRPRQEIDQ